MSSYKSAIRLTMLATWRVREKMGRSWVLFLVGVVGDMAVYRRVQQHISINHNESYVFSHRELPREGWNSPGIVRSL